MGDNCFKIYGLDGVNADIVSVSRVIDGFDGVEHVISGFRYACDLGIESGDYGEERVYDAKAGIFECSVSDVSSEGLEELLRGTNLKTK